MEILNHPVYSFLGKSVCKGGWLWSSSCDVKYRETARVARENPRVSICGCSGSRKQEIRASLACHLHTYSCALLLSSLLDRFSPSLCSPSTPQYALAQSNDVFTPAHATFALQHVSSHLCHQCSPKIRWIQSSWTTASSSPRSKGV